MDEYVPADVEATPPEVLNVREVAELWNVSESTVWHWVRTGRLPAFRVGGSVRVRSIDANRFEVPYEVRSR
jgi:excisionase family DNA binding protein